MQLIWTFKVQESDKYEADQGRRDLVMSRPNSGHRVALTFREMVALRDTLNEEIERRYEVKFL
jgi:hypothetical protein